MSHHHSQSLTRLKFERTGGLSAWLPGDLRQALTRIARRERMPVVDLVRVAVRELVRAYRAPTKNGADATTPCAESTTKKSFCIEPSEPPAAPTVTSAKPDERLETVWRPGRNAPSLLGERESKVP
jgi:hypothetical protein